MTLGLGALYNWQLWYCEGASWILWSKLVGFVICLGWVSLFWAIQDGFFQFRRQNGTIVLFTEKYIYQSTTVSEICSDLPLFGYSSLENLSFPLYSKSMNSSSMEKFWKFFMIFEFHKKFSGKFENYFFKELKYHKKLKFPKLKNTKSVKSLHISETVVDWYIYFGKRWYLAILGQFRLQELRNQLLVYSQMGQIQNAYYIRLKLQKYPLRFGLVANRSSPLLILYYRPLRSFTSCKIFCLF